jgi:hypothetical protein
MRCPRGVSLLLRGDQEQCQAEQDTDDRGDDEERADGVVGERLEGHQARLYAPPHSESEQAHNLTRFCDARKGPA